MALGNKASQAASEMPDGEEGGLPKGFKPAHANNTSRSLQIISVQQGWDPREIIGETYKPREMGVSDTSYGFDAGTNDSLESPELSPKTTFNTPDRKPKRTPKGSNPFPGGGWE